MDYSHSYLDRFSFGVVPFIAVAILASHHISHILSCSGRSHLLRVGSRLRALALPTFVTLRLADLLKLDLSVNTDKPFFIILKNIKYKLFVLP